MYHAWNTQRLYTTNGQRIAAKLINDTVVFADIDRGICGQFQTILMPNNPYELREDVMLRYDLGNYQPYWGDDLDDLTKLARAL